MINSNNFYSIVIPCYNSSKSIKKVISSTINELDKIGIKKYEFVLVNDCSPDGRQTISVLKELAKKYKFIKVIDLAKNAGQHNATMEGLRYTVGDFVISMDDDLQTDPSQIVLLLETMEEQDYDIIYGFYPKKKHNVFRNLLSKLNYISVRFLIGKPKGLETSSFWVIKKFVRNYVIQYHNAFPYLQGLFLRTTDNIGCIPIQHKKREFGESNYTFKKLFKLWGNILGFSIKPLRLAMYIGSTIACLSVLAIICIIISKVLNPQITAGWSSMMVVLCFFSGLILFFLGLIGEYIGRIYLAINADPPCIVRNVYNAESLDIKSESFRYKDSELLR